MKNIYCKCDRCGNEMSSEEGTFPSIKTVRMDRFGLGESALVIDADKNSEGFFILCDGCLDELSTFLNGEEVVPCR